jgi:hypothetical protein
MRLPGRLSATTLGDLLGALHRDRASGVLELIESGGACRVHRVHLDAGLVEAVETSLGVVRIGELLRREGFLGDDGLRRFLRRLSGSGKRRAGDLLLEDQMVTAPVLRAALRRQLRERLEALFALSDASVRFRVARPRSPEANRAAPLSPREFLHGRARSRARRGAPPRTKPAAPPPANDVRRRALGVLGLGEGADRESVQRAFRKLAAGVHPDRHPAASAEERARLMRRFVELSAAYHALVA